MSILNMNDIFQIAMQIESSGEKFYRNLAATFKNKNSEISKLYESLADEEIKHFKTFEKMLNSLKNSSTDHFDNIPDDYRDYLKSYTDNIIFTNEKLQNEAENISTITQALEQSIKRELDSILYYQEIKDIVLKSDIEPINNIIMEERKHFIRLSTLKDKYK